MVPPWQLVVSGRGETSFSAVGQGDKFNIHRSRKRSSGWSLADGPRWRTNLFESFYFPVNYSMNGARYPLFYSSHSSVLLHFLGSPFNSSDFGCCIYIRLVIIYTESHFMYAFINTLYTLSTGVQVTQHGTIFKEANYEWNDVISVAIIRLNFAVGLYAILHELSIDCHMVIILCRGIFLVAQPSAKQRTEKSRVNWNSAWNN